ncbi:DUF814 domain-containing protein, partial [Vibrio parahaemolyticus]|nr:DUF814 domain-containing protein [Vibrio parahaemolyticus]
KQKRDTTNQTKPLHYVSSDGYDIYVGKNNVQNEFLTTKFAKKDDLWLHAKNIPGSHVIVKSKNSDFPETTIFEAAYLAALHSRNQHESKIEVDYTRKLLL